jgi:glycosyltransferase involved in cell wall biosynthesis
MTTPAISVLVLTRDEQQDLPGCLASLAWSDDIHVLDSLSSDDTAAIAQRMGARVTSRPFDNWSDHQNWALRNIPFRHPWVYYSDADERVTPTLATALAAAVAAPGDHAAFRVRRRDYLMGTWLRHVTASPFNIRLFRPEHVHYERRINPVTVVDGAVGDIDAHFDHYSFSKGFAHWFDKHNRYSTLEAEQILADRQAEVAASLLTALTDGDRNVRRMHQKRIFYRLPLRPLVKFMLLYFGRLGFLDGRAGLTYALLQSIYEYMIVLKTREAASANRPAP